MSKKGRHRDDAPRVKTLTLRLTETEFAELTEYAEQNDLSKTKVLMDAFQEMKNQRSEE